MVVAFTVGSSVAVYICGDSLRTVLALDLRGQQPMNKAEKKNILNYLEKLAVMIGQEETDWVAITVKFADSRITLHTKDAPKRPQGLSE
ncbi:hypothetical protein LCGC14_1781570 [marine sediment metagenome]|uniref:Uncharacterized protein n=1 Tax=marine sediment metagenome TaxID=412755 RepID=A0A0F9HHV6_9ZZZZ